MARRSPRGSSHSQREATAGFSLIEVLIAITVFTIGILAVITMQSTSVGGNAKARYISEASTYAADQMEQLMNKVYSDSALTDTDGNGTTGLDYGKVANSCCPNGKDPWGKTVTGCTKFADHCAPLSSDARYGVYWNVADNQPVNDLKSIRVIVASPLLLTPVTVNSIKSNAP